MNRRKSTFKSTPRWLFVGADFSKNKQKNFERSQFANLNPHNKRLTANSKRLTASSWLSRFCRPTNTRLLLFNLCSFFFAVPLSRPFLGNQAYTRHEPTIGLTNMPREPLRCFLKISLTLSLLLNKGWHCKFTELPHANGHALCLQHSTTYMLLNSTMVIPRQCEHSTTAVYTRYFNYTTSRMHRITFR